MKRFNISRNNEIVACGVLFDCGKCAVCWNGVYSSVVVWNCFDDLKAVNGQGNTLFDFIDEDKNSSLINEDCDKCGCLLNKEQRELIGRFNKK